MRSGLKKTKRLTADAFLLSAAFILSWIEMLIPVPVPIPGIKLGLANLAILFTLCYCGAPDALVVLCGRLFLNALLFGNASSFIFSASGGLVSFAVMLILRILLRDRVIIISIAGGVFHNLGQLAAARIILSVSVWVYTPYLVLGGIAAGTLNGVVADRLLKSPAFKEKRDHGTGNENRK